MDNLGSFAQFTSNQSEPINLPIFLVNLILAMVMSQILSWFYVRYGRSLSNRKSFSSNFMLIASTTLLVISIVKSSLALSLGLVGALSIVRFRTAIKEPEELAFVFLAIAIGLGLGANQTVLTVVAFPIIVGAVWVRGKFKRQSEPVNMHINLSSENSASVPLEKVVESLKQDATYVDLRRFDEQKNSVDMTLKVEFENFSKICMAKDKLKSLSPDMRITYVEPSNI